MGKLRGWEQGRSSRKVSVSRGGEVEKVRGRSSRGAVGK